MADRWLGFPARCVTCGRVTVHRHCGCGTPFCPRCADDGTDLRHPRRQIVTLCGSVRFREDFERENERLTLAGHIVLSVGCFDHAWLHRPENNAELAKDGLDALHKDKIAMSDWVRVLNRGGYVGKSTRAEIEYAEARGIPVQYMEVRDG